MTVQSAADGARAITRARLLCVTVLIGVLPWFVAPGLVVGDTKVDLVLSPLRYLGRSLSAWNTHTGVGELQNQAYGYLWPMGPFFAAGDLAGLPEWAIQRAWWTVLLVVAFLGAERLIRRITPVGPIASVMGALAYALAPRVLTLLSENSVETWPVALAPWLVLVVVAAVSPQADGTDRRRAALRTIPLVATLGGVNATASLLAIVPAALWIAVAPRQVPRWRAAAWWLPAVLVGALWWLAPLVVLGRYAYPFMDFIESASTTTAVTSVSNVLRGSDHWVGWILDSAGHPVWQSGWVLAQYVPAILATCAVAGAALWGLASIQDRQLARWLAASLTLGVVAMAAGHGGTATSPLAPWVRELLDGPLSPARNVHKADLLVRLPMAVGIAMTVCRVAAHVRPGRGAQRLVAASVAGALFVGATLPIWIGRVGDAWPWREVPREWNQLALAVDRSAALEGGNTLLLPASRFADYSWGTPDDEPLSALATSPVLVRGSAPLGHPGLTRVLDELDLAASQGREVAGLAQTLSRIGVQRIVLRRNLSASVQAEDWRAVEATLQQSGLRLQRTFGTGSGALSLYAVSSRAVAPEAVAYPTDSLVTVGGGPEAIPQLLASGALSQEQAAVLADDPQIATDGLRLRSFNAGRPTLGAYGPTVAALPDQSRPDLPPAGGGLGQTTRVWGDGIRSVHVSSSGADPFSREPSGPGAGPAAAFDGDPETSWLSGDRAREQWLEVERAADAPAGRLRATLASGDGITPIATATVSVDGRAIASTLIGKTLEATLPAGAHRVRIQLKGGFAAGGKVVLGLTEVSLPGLGEEPASRLAVPGGPATTTVSLQPSLVARSVDGRLGEDSLASWSRVINGLAPDQPWQATRVELTPRFGPDLDRALDGVEIVGSSRDDQRPDHRPGAALDGDLATGWRPGSNDADPSVTFTLDQLPRSVRLASAPSGLQVVIAQPGRGAITLRDTAPTPVSLVSGVPVTVTYFGLSSGAAAPDLLFDRPPVPALTGLTIGCDEGTPSIRLGQVRATYAGTWTREQLLPGTPTQGRPCASSPPVIRSIRGSGLEVVAAAGQGAAVTAIELSRNDVAPPRALATRSVQVVSSTPGHYVFEVAAGPSVLLTLTQGANAGWVAQAGGTPLRSQIVDGWRAGFALPAGERVRVSVDFAPDRAYRWGIIAGLVLAALALAGVLLDGRRRSRGSAPGAMTTPTTVTTLTTTTTGRRAPTARRAAAIPLALGVLMIAWVIAGWWGSLVALPVLLAPRAARRWIALAAITLAGFGLCLLGAAEQFSAGALNGQVGGTVSVVAAVAALTNLSSPWSWPVRPSRSAARSGDTSPPTTPA